MIVQMRALPSVVVAQYAFDGWQFAGKVVATIVGGKIVFEAP
jgi:dihydroorotase-like cyclic amidohydrolase